LGQKSLQTDRLKRNGLLFVIGRGHGQLGFQRSSIEQFARQERFRDFSRQRTRGMLFRGESPIITSARPAAQCKHEKKGGAYSPGFRGPGAGGQSKQTIRRIPIDFRSPRGVWKDPAEFHQTGMSVPLKRRDPRAEMSVFL
jgi:hypothetical protein